jgi:hypothetical protein
VVDLAVIAGCQAGGAGAAAVARVADDALIGGGDAGLAAQVQGAFAVVVEHRQVVDTAVGGHPDHITHRQRGVTAGTRRAGHRDVGVGDGVGGLVADVAKDRGYGMFEVA